MADALLDAVRRDREHEPADERWPSRKPQLPDPSAGRKPSQHVEDQRQQVPPDDHPGHGRNRPEEEPVRPAGVVGLRPGLGPERVRVAPRRTAVLELVADEPVVVQRLEVVPGRGLAVPRRSAREEVRARVHDGGPRRADPRYEVEEERERYEARTARSSSAKSGSSPGSYRHAPRTVQSGPTTNAERSATPRSPL